MADSSERNLVLGSRTVVYLLRRSRRRSFGMTIDGKGLRVSVPLQATIRDTEAFIRAHADWVLEKLDAWAERSLAVRFGVADGARLPVLGQDCRLRLVHGGSRPRWLEGLAERELQLPVRPGADPRIALRRALQTYALGYFGGRLEEYLHTLSLIVGGIPAPGLALSSARTRWGSCSRHSGIRLNWRLIHLEPALVDYVVAHEVAHLVEMNHSTRFWAVVEALYPDWRSARAALKQAGERIPDL